MDANIQMLVTEQKISIKLFSNNFLIHVSDKNSLMEIKINIHITKTPKPTGIKAVFACDI